MKKFALIVAAGNGSRMGKQLPKQYLQLAGKPVLLHTIEAFFRAFPDIRIVLVVPGDHPGETGSIVSLSPLPASIRVVIGADTRFGSVKAGLQWVEDDSIVFIHDGVRCLLSDELIHRCYEGALAHGNAIPAISAVDSMRILKNGKSETLDRDHVKLVQTPQTFGGKAIREAYLHAKPGPFSDDAAVAEQSGIIIHLVEGENTNIKITHPSDLLLADHILRERNLIS